MRRITLTALVTATALAVAATPALAVNSPLKFEASVSPAKAGTKANPAPVALNLRPFYDTLEPDAEAPFAWTEATIYLPKELVFNAKRFKSCTAVQVRNAATRSNCASAKLGNVAAKGFALGLVEPLVVGLYNGPGGNTVLLHIVGDTPVIIDAVVEGKLKKVSGKYGWEMKFGVPADLQQPAPGAFATPLDFKTTVAKRTIKKGSKKIPFVGLTGCPAGGLNFGFGAKYTDGTSSLVELTQPCKK